jgi:hypothetical protein
MLNYLNIVVVCGGITKKNQIYSVESESSCVIKDIFIKQASKPLGFLSPNNYTEA